MSSPGTFFIILLLTAGALALGRALHWVIGLAQRRAVRRWAPEHSPLPGLLINWCGNGLRTIVWGLCGWFVANLLPQMRARLETLVEKLWQMRDHVGAWLLDTGVNVVIDLVATVFLMRFAAALIGAGFELFENRALERGETSARRRSQTLAAIFRGAAQSLILFFGALAILQHLRVNVTPILASAGVVGLALGFGAQSLIKDFFAGFMILLEDQYNVGDTVKIGEAAGKVERLTLRMTLIRALDGSLTTIPNGAITTVSNFSKDWSRAVLDCEIDYDEDADRAMEVMLTTARQLRAERPEELLEDPVVLGVERISHTSIALRLTVKTAVNRQNECARELRRRLKLAFATVGIKPPAPERLVLKEGQKG